tara:strand:+ start:86 stop:307 length:222 start_codon:yes stop_codon:yes gene_type:complete
MATELKTIKGKFQNEKTNEMETTKMTLVRFWGGDEGTKLQLTLETTGQLFTHITLTREELKILVNEIKDNFNI